MISNINTNLMIEILCLFSSVFFILTLKSLSSPKSSVKGILFSIIGIVLALIAGLLIAGSNYTFLLLIIIALGAIIGSYIAIKTPITSVPQLVAGFHSFVGLAAVLVSYSVISGPGAISKIKFIEISLGSIIGAITFSGSVVAFATLHGLIKAKRLSFIGQNYVIFILFLLLIVIFFISIYSCNVVLFNIMTLISFILGALLTMNIGGADMPVVISVLNSYSGLASVGVGFTFNNKLLIITGAIVAASGAILSYIMCKSMNRSLLNVIFGGVISNQSSQSTTVDTKTFNKCNAEDASFILNTSQNLIIVPGYGMAVSRAQHAVKELFNILCEKGVGVRFAIHPVAGRMPGHMNVLLAEAGIDYQYILELDDINNDFNTTDVVLVIGANDITNPAARTDNQSPIYGMPILNVDFAQTILFIKRSMSTGYANVENELFFKENTMMLLGDAKQVVEDIVKLLKQT
ncbi:NAD(P)(+) transhydrogenase (Re/Si-specific) subunit beta [Rickettsia endosymbiont of Cardiosporidium cionae]|uniref:NAD(P)(+) transhydrogenase (Re/Si-specific) subunit beta n=1 Tax=Rickettsia endosymbiont of Cardiosporidium cionae TaxID=2777155 RepID=UPI001893DE6F|nr:NAD(P)(+) transhydrogenase (Re/Si-specific) subunit beta [Rickettsia endosymbiont of Cardiosporidium cionae]KAF8818984.1 NAD synthetase [Rickettsia endosymbiont of Cardiosporidium cionae]